GIGLQKRQQGARAKTLERSYNAQKRLNRRYWKLVTNKINPNVAITAVARELAGFLWAEMVATD
ncbi:transposase, partial [mine drainage metagenome]